VSLPSSFIRNQAYRSRPMHAQSPASRAYGATIKSSHLHNSHHLRHYYATTFCLPAALTCSVPRRYNSDRGSSIRARGLPCSTIRPSDSTNTRVHSSRTVDSR
jgi:hypothetical protein